MRKTVRKRSTKIYYAMSRLAIEETIAFLALASMTKKKSFMRLTTSRQTKVLFLLFDPLKLKPFLTEWKKNIAS
jgi:hypothetical protein